jgi:NADH-quinone oxidoreductase subunit D
MHQVEIATTQETLLDSPEMVLNMGPQHPSTHGVLRVVLRLDGETVIDLDCDIGYLHRGMEKIAENRMYTHDRAVLGSARLHRRGFKRSGLG